jgi:hypothetical protein
MYIFLVAFMPRNRRFVLARNFHCDISRVVNFHLVLLVLNWQNEQKKSQQAPSARLQAIVIDYTTSPQSIIKTFIYLGNCRKAHCSQDC